MRYPRLRNEETNEFRKETLRLVKEVAEDEVKLEKARRLVRDYECEGNKVKAEDESYYIEDCINRKFRMIELLDRY